MSIISVIGEHAAIRHRAEILVHHVELHDGAFDTAQEVAVRPACMAGFRACGENRLRARDLGSCGRIPITPPRAGSDARGDDPQITDASPVTWLNVAVQSATRIGPPPRNIRAVGDAVGTCAFRIVLCGY